MHLKKLPPPGIELIKITEVAEILECTRDHVYSLLSKDKLDWIKKGPRTTRVVKDSVDRYITSVNK